MTTVIILRGIPGSGKTTWANDFAARHPGTIIASADDAFQTETDYNYVETMVSAAHLACRIRVERAIYAGAPFVLVDNTHTRRWEYARTIDIARNAGALIFQHVCTGNWPSVHEVPADKMVHMRKRFEPDETLPAWKEETA
jgi:predicted kinase